jgi:hypothetical protein
MPPRLSNRPAFDAVTRHLRKVFTLDTRSLAVYRIGLGLLLVIDAVDRVPDVSIMMGPDGIFPLAALRQYYGTITLWSLAALHDSVAWSATVLALEGLAGIALALGCFTRLATIVGWVALMSVIRRTSLAANAGDVWLACQMFWAMFLPLGARWSVDALRRDGHPISPPIPGAACSVATAAIVVQLVVVYLGAGLAKCNADWFTGDALIHAISVHDHGTPLGMTVGNDPWVTRPLQWAVVAGEVGLPLVLLAMPAPTIRIGIVALFSIFHVAIWLGMTVGLFPLVGLVAWLVVLPAEFWGRRERAGETRVATLGLTASWTCGCACVIAAMAFILQLPWWRQEQLPLPLAMAVNLTGLHQEWQMFGGVPARAQWVYGRALLADGSEVDLLRGGRPVERDLPAGGFTSLPHHRWHTFFWHLARPTATVFADPSARALAKQWNASHGPDKRVVSLEIRYGFQASGEDAMVRDIVMASWPPRSGGGAGNLDRFLESLDGPKADEPRPDVD